MSLICQSERRRDQTGPAPFFRLDYVEVSYPDPNQPLAPVLTVYFIGRAPAQGSEPGQISLANLRLDGGQRIRDIQATSLVVHQEDETQDDFMEVTVDRDGDFSTYTLSAVALDERGHPTARPMPGFDPRYASIGFSFKACCPSDLDCKQAPVCPPPARNEPEINYLSKDYSSFRQLILDRLAVLMPDWRERHVPDLGIALVELLAYVGDYLSYYQDAVATEAYLQTARRRISVRRHARLVDYRMHEGCNARTWLWIETDAGENGYKLNLKDCYFISTPEGSQLPEDPILPKEALAGISPGAYEVFEALNRESITVWQTQSRMEFYTWGDLECCLPKGTTSATLKNGWSGDQPPALPPLDKKKTADGPSENGRPVPGQPQVGDVLIFEEILGPHTGNSADADPSRRHAIRLTSVEAVTDPLNRAPLLEIRWGPEDALPFPFCLSARLPAPDCGIRTDISVARGNVILVDSGKTIDRWEDLGQVEIETVEGQCACEGSAVEMTYLAAPFRPALNQPPLTFSQPLAAKPLAPATGLLAQDPRQALPQIGLKNIPPSPDGAGPLFNLEDWEDPAALAKRLLDPADPATQPLRGRLSSKIGEALDQWKDDGTAPPGLAEALAGLLEDWSPALDLLESRPLDTMFVVEIDDDGRAHLRFGDGDLGRQPEAGAEFLARYRVGNGPAANLPADSITKIIFRNSLVSGVLLRPRNPLPAQGGTAPEPVAEVKLFAPGAFRKRLERAITAADYATLAERNQKLQNASATLRWTGSWYEAQVAVDPLGSETADEGRLNEIKGYLHRFRRMGHDLVVHPARYVPLEIEMAICVLPHFLRGHVEAALLDALSTRVLPDGRLGFFHPDNLSFGEGIYLSRLVAAAQSVTGVQSVQVTKLQRLFSLPAGVSDPTALESGVLTLSSLEVAQLDNDPNFPEHGRLTLRLGGGR